jgi:hypothetical protein
MMTRYEFPVRRMAANRIPLGFSQGVSGGGRLKVDTNCIIQIMLDDH